MRIVGGRRKGLALQAPKGLSTRPTSDRLRETIFNVLVHRFGGVEGSRVLDLFAGSGAMGLEALSRGAAFAVFVDTAHEARAAVRRNLEAAGVLASTKVWRRDAAKLGENPLPPFDLVFADPPYGLGLGERALDAAAIGGWTASSALAVLEERADAQPRAIAGWSLIDERRTGQTSVSFWSRTAAP